VATRFRSGQRLKPNSFCVLYGTAEAVPYEDSAFAKQALKPAPLLLLRLLAQCSARQFCAIGKHDLAQHSHRRALLAGNECDRDLVAGM
jgi:hypothetical protein